MLKSKRKSEIFHVQFTYGNGEKGLLAGESTHEIGTTLNETRFKESGEMSSTKADTNGNKYLNTCASVASNGLTTLLAQNDIELIEHKNIEIRKFGIYASYYIKGIKIEFEDENLKTTSVIHAPSDFNSEADYKLKYYEMIVDDGEYIDRINLVKSSQTGCIRSIMVSTNYQRNLVAEGEIELHNANLQEFSEQIILEKSSEDINLVETPVSRHSQSLIDSSNIVQHQNSALVQEQPNNEDSSDNDDIRKASIIDVDFKYQNCNLKHINHRLVGIKTLFSN